MPFTFCCLPAKIRKTVFIHPLLYLSLAAFIITVWLNLSYWITIAHLMPLKLHTIPFFISQIILVFCFNVLLLLTLCWAWTSRIIVIILFIISLFCSYFSYTYNIYFDRGIISSIFLTDSHEARELLTVKLLVWSVFFALPAAIFLLKFKPAPTPKILQAFLLRWLFAASIILLGFMATAPIYKHYASFYRNHHQLGKMIAPINFIVALANYANNQHNIQRHFQVIAADAVLKPLSAPRTWVLVIGETARADRFSLNAYHQKTNALLETVDNLISFQHASSCGTYTAYSVPCIFSDLSRKQFDVDAAPYRENLLDIANKVGIAVTWIDNQSGCQGVCQRIAHKSLYDDCPEGLCHDGQLVDALKKQLSLASAPERLIILHMNGSHGPAYYQRYPKQAKKFTPTCDTNSIENCSADALNNTYDNTIVYTDDILYHIIQLLSALPGDAAMLYVSDHGESLGEGGWYLHGAPYSIAPKEQTHIPFILWFNSAYAKAGINLSCLKEIAHTLSVSHDNVFYTLLSGLNIQTRINQKSSDLFSICR